MTGKTVCTTPFAAFDAALFLPAIPASAGKPPHQGFVVQKVRAADDYE